MARSTYFDQGRIADACPGSESGYAQRFQCGNIVKRLIWTRMILLKPVLVTKDNIKTTVVKDGFQTLKDINQGLPKDEQIN